MKGELIYGSLLLLYPKSFRARFGREMLQFFRDCRPETRAAAFWIDTLRDLVVSVPREWGREIQREDSAIDYTGLTDALMVTSVVVPMLLWLGWAVTVILLDLDPHAQDTLRWSTVAVILIVLATLAMSCLVGVLSTMAAARTGRIDTTPWSKLGTSGKPTARYSR
jgi:hypothetical protein